MRTPPDAAWLAAAFDLGATRGPPTYVAGGERGDVWKLTTSTGEWAVKQSQTGVAVDADASRADLAFQQAVLDAGQVLMPQPMVTASGSPLLVESATGHGYRVYEWVDHVPGATVDPRVAGALLARIHAVDHPADAASVDPWFYEPVGEDELRSFVLRAERAGVAWASLLEHRLDDLVETLAVVPGTPPERLRCCHRDLGSDNVLVDPSGRPWVIDWENSGGADPDEELAQAVVFFGDAVLDGYRAAGGPGELHGIETFAMTFVVQANYLAHCVRDVLDRGPDVARRRSTIAERLLQDLVTVADAHRILARASA